MQVLSLLPAASFAIVNFPLKIPFHLVDEIESSFLDVPIQAGIHDGLANGANGDHLVRAEEVSQIFRFELVVRALGLLLKMGK
jgi:hypothetical protein